PGVILALFGKFYIAGPYTLLVIPLNFVFSIIMYYQQKETFKMLNLTIRRNIVGYFMFLLFYQIIHSPISVLGYFQEIFKSERVWK
ncbi:MAG: glycosyltransferase family 2 protein, partial [Caldiserica bacterium]